MSYTFHPTLSELVEAGVVLLCPQCLGRGFWRPVELEGEAEDCPICQGRKVVPLKAPTPNQEKAQSE